MDNKAKEKFQFNPDFQELILKYTVLDKKGYKALQLYDETYFSLLSHSIIAYTLKRYYKKNKRVPELPLLRESLRSLYQSQNKSFRLLKKEDKVEIDDTLNRIYQGTISGGNDIMEGVVSFARYINFKTELEKIDVLDYDSYNQYATKIRNAINIGMDKTEGHGTFLVEGIKDRAHKRDINELVYPTPFWQLNRLLNAGGLSPASLVLLAGEAKRFKTGFLINIGIFYMKRRKKVLYIDLENSERALIVRGEQSVIGAKKDQIVSGKMDNKLLKLLRKYRRLGAELVIKRFPAYTTTIGDIQSYLDLLKVESGIEFDVFILDNPDLLGALSGKNEEVNRISDVYIETKNFLEFNEFECGYVPSHTKAQAEKHRGTRYTQYDLAKCLDKIRWVDSALGLQESEEEIDAGIIRLEVMEQRDGIHGRCLFWVDFEKQQMREFTRKEVDKYEEEYRIDYDRDNKPKEKKQSHQNNDL